MVILLIALCWLACLALFSCLCAKATKSRRVRGRTRRFPTLSGSSYAAHGRRRRAPQQLHF